MFEYSGGDEDCGAWWKLNHQLQIPEYEMAATHGVEISDHGDGAPPIGNVEVIGVSISNCLQADIECSSSERVSAEVGP